MPLLPEDSTDILKGDDEPEDSTNEVGNKGGEMEENVLPIMLSRSQIDAAGMTDAQPGDTFTVKVTVANSTPEGADITLQPGSAVKDMAEEEKAPAMRKGKQSVKGPMDLGFGSEDDGFEPPAPTLA